MKKTIIGAIGLLLRLAGLLLGLAWVIVGIAKVAGMSQDEKVNGPGFIGFGLFAVAIVFAFSMRKRIAKKRAEARKAKALQTGGMLAEAVVARVREHLILLRRSIWTVGAGSAQLAG